jgi:monothiol glutaredoxin
MCGFSSVASAILKKCGVNFSHCNVLDDEKIREGIKIFSNWPTIPQLYIQKEFVGGCDIMKEMAESGELIELFNTRGIKTEIS